MKYYHLSMKYLFVRWGNQIIFNKDAAQRNHYFFFRSFWVLGLFTGLTLPVLGVSQTVPGRYLKEVLPCNGCEVSTFVSNYPMAGKKGKNINYDVELDKDTLSDTPAMLQKTALPYSILIPYLPLKKVNIIGGIK